MRRRREFTSSTLALMSCWRQGHPVVISLCEKNSSASFCKAAREKKESFIVTYSGDDIVAAINPNR